MPNPVDISKFGGGVVVRESQYIDSPPESLTAAMRAFFENLKPQTELAAASKERLAIESHSGAFLNSPDSFKAFLDLNPAPEHVGIAIAPYHLQIIKAAIEEIIHQTGTGFAPTDGEPVLLRLLGVEGLGDAGFQFGVELGVALEGLFSGVAALGELVAVVAEP